MSRLLSKCRRFVTLSAPTFKTVRLRKFSRSKYAFAGNKLQWSYTHGVSDVPLLGATIGNIMEAAAEKHPGRELVVFCQSGERFTAEQLLDKSDQLAAGLVAMGLQRGDRVGIWAPNYKEWILAQYGTARAGIVLVNINPAYQASELEYALRKVGVKAIIAAESYKTQDYYGLLQTICPELDRCTPGHLKSSRLPELMSVIMISDKDFNGAVRFSDVMGMGTSKHREYIRDLQHRLQFDECINIQFTSGTTGIPKGATLTHHNIVNNALFVGMKLDYHRRESRICMPVPLYHCFGMVLGSLQSIVHGATLVLPSPSFEPEACLQAVHQEKCTSLYGTPTMFIDMLHFPTFDQFDLSSLYTGIMAGSPCPIEVMKNVVSRMHMSQVTICYGTTENSPVSFQSDMDDSLERRVSTIGRAHPHVEVKVVNGAGEVLPVGAKGELCIRGYGVMQNYWDDPAKTAEVIGQDRWYKTGDIAILDEDGYGQIVGRNKDLIIRGGENIYPVEVEQYLYKHPKIADVQVIGVPDERLGEQVCAWIKLKPDQTASEKEIKDFCKGQMSHFKIPHYISFVDSYPLTVTGKVQKFKMREEAVEMLGLKPL